MANRKQKGHTPSFEVLRHVDRNVLKNGDGGGIAMVSQSEVFDLFRRWQDNRTQLRIDADFPGVSRLSIETVIARVEEPLIGVDLAKSGYIELLFVENWHFEFGAHDAMRTRLTDRTGASSSRSRGQRRMNLEK